MKRLFFATLMLISSLAFAGEKVAYQNWTVESTPQSHEAYTIADAQTSFGTFCSGDQCLFYLHQNLNCSPGSKYSVLMNSPSLSTALTMECTLIGGNLFQILTPFEAVLKASQAGDSIGFAVALQSGAFAVSRFSLNGAKQAIDRVLTEAAQSKSRATRPAPPTVVIPMIPIAPINPPVQIIPRQAPNQVPQSNSKDISI
ncbi:hypothetical protein [Polynucleobacter sphagniphilus]|uniref:hypothetical protein n=1 Tax=Polynucleobacter sphagniphilus TaxID=1743169 RepID=UPI0024750552|nr:hypothetical protein [Polynucleobacter sphagniphilus]MDH6249862.1 hypothetical protein [Polynucleobacter sphagniphilus]MDH6300796.1 hypothetical protein [Polynucleobacter sphagniphilus]